MQPNALTPPSADAEPLVNDLGPLAWVLDELRKSLDGAAKALKRFVKEAEAARGSDLAALDASQLRIARQQLHQAVGALEMVGLLGPALVLRSMETAVQKFVQQPEQCSHDAASRIERASFALTEYLEAVLADRPISAVSLFPQYREVQELVKADRIHPADLWAHEWRWLDPQIGNMPAPLVYDASSRSLFDMSVLQTMKSTAPQAAHKLKALCLGFSANHADKHPKIFWKIAAAFFESLAHELVVVDIYVKRVASRVLLQYATLSKGYDESDSPISERLAQDLLFYCSQSVSARATDTPVLSAVRATFGLTRFKPVDYESVQFGRFDPALLAQARKRIASAKETWSSLSAGDNTKFKVVLDQFSLVSDSLVKLHPPSEPLAKALSRSIEFTSKSGQAPSVELSMEVATSVLYLEAAFEDLDPNDPNLTVRTLRLAERLEGVRSGGLAQPLESWMEELYRRVSDKQTMGSVVGELRLSLGELEKSLDVFFRNPKEKGALRNVPSQLSQMRGVLSVLGLEQASQAVLRMRDSVEAMLVTEVDEQQARAAGTFEHLGNNLGALSFLIDMLNYQPALAKKLFVFDDTTGELRPLMGRTERPAESETVTVHDESDAQAEQVQVFELPAELAAVPVPPAELMVAPTLAVMPADVQAKAFSDTVTFTAPQMPAIAAETPAALPAVAAVAASASLAVAGALALAAPASPVVIAVTKSVAPPPAADSSDEDDELREIFLEEAREVTSNGLASVGLLAFNPTDIDQLTILRRVFHTLKGSSRMVQLNEFGEAGWAMEQLFNSWLADQKPASEDIRALATDSLNAFSRWIDDIASNHAGHWTAAPFRASAEAMRVEGRYFALAFAEPVEAAVAAPLPPTEATHVSAEVEQLPEATAVAEEPMSMDLAQPVAELPTPDVQVAVAPVTVLEVVDSSPSPVAAYAETMALAVSVPALQPDTAVATPAPLDTVAEVEPAQATALQDEVIDFDAFFSVESETQAQPTSAEIAPPQLPQAVVSLDDVLDLDSVSALAGSAEAEDEAAELEALQLQLDAFERESVLAAEAAALAATQALEEQRLAEAAAEEAALAAVQEIPEISPEQLRDAALADQDQAALLTVALSPVPAVQEVSASEDEQIKVIGDLRIGIPLYNVYLNEADEWSRRLVAELSEWAIEHRAPVNDSAVSFAHSLAGTSATVGFTALSDIARVLEDVLLKSQAHFSYESAGSYANLLVEASEDIRRLLHQFAAGFLKTANPDVLTRLRAIEFPEIESVSESALLEEAIDTGGSTEVAVFEAEAVVSVQEVAELPAQVEPAPTVAAVEQPVAVAVVPTALAALGVGAVLQTAFSPPTALQSVPEQAAYVPDPAFQSAPVQSFAADAADLDDEIDAVDAIDPELFEIFEEEAEELMPQLGGALRQWSSRPADKGARLEVLRVLHTLKGSARLAGAMRLGEMAHNIETEIEFLGSDDAASAEFEPLIARFDSMESAFEKLRKGEAAEQLADNAQALSLAIPLAAPPVAAQAAFVPTSAPAPVAALAEKIAPLTPFEAVVAAVGATAAAELPPTFAADEAPPAAAASSAPAAAATGTRVMVPAPQLLARQPLRQAASASIRVRSQLLDRLVNQAGEVMITRSRLEVELNQLRSSLGDMSGNLNRLRQQLRDIEVQAESQMQSRLAQAKEAQAGFDPLEFDRFTRVQELTRMMAESVNDVATVQRTLQRTVEATEDDLIAQARQTRELQRDLLRTRMVEFEGISERLYRVVRQASKDANKQVRLDLLGGTIEMDRGMLDRMTPAFEHLLRNCVAHGIESPELRTAAGKDPVGLITVHLRQEGNDVSVEFSDDGAGLNLPRIREKGVSLGLVQPGQILSDQDAANLIFMPGFSTAAQVTELSGRGIGMDVVRSEVNGIGGRIETSTAAGKGSNFKLVLPLTTAVTQVVMIRSGKLSVGVPANVVETVRRLPSKDLQAAYNTGQIEIGGELLPFFWSGALLQSSQNSNEPQAKTTPIVVFRSAAQRIALHVDEVLGNQEVVVKNLGPQLSRLPGLAGMSVLASGAVVLIYNPVALASVYGEQARALSADRAEPQALEAAGRTPTAASVLTPTAPQIPLILVVDDSITVRRVTQRLLLREGYRVSMAADGLQALERLQEERPAVVLSDIEMPRMDGFDLARNIRGDARLADLPIVMITSRIAEKHREHAKSLGVDHYLGKPYSEEELMSLVRHYCNLATVSA